MSEPQYILLPYPLTQAQVDEIKAAWLRAYGGPGRVNHTVMFVESARIETPTEALQRIIDRMDSHIARLREFAS